MKIVLTQPEVENLIRSYICIKFKQQPEACLVMLEHNSLKVKSGLQTIVTILEAKDEVHPFCKN